MFRHVLTAMAVLFLMAFFIGCGGRSDPIGVAPNSSDINKINDTNSTNRSLWGLWHCYMDPGNNQIEIVPLRSATFTANVNNLLEGNPGNLLIEDMDTTDFFTEGRLDCTVTLKHPLPGLTQYNGFDVWGVFMHNSNGSLNYDGLTYGADPDAGENVAVLLNPDGWTRWFNYTEFDGSGIPILEYFPGKLSNLPNPTATLNPFKIYSDALDFDEDYYEWISTPGNADNRGWFTAGSVNSRRYELEFPIIDSAPVVDFQYAVIATWEQGDPALTGNPDIYEPGDFPSSANCEEAFYVNVSTIDSDLYYAAPDDFGGNFLANIEVFDWQGGSVGGLGVPNEIESIVIEGNFIPGGSHEFSQAELTMVAASGTENSSVFQVEIGSCAPQASGEADLWVIVEADGLNGDSFDQGFPTEYPAGACRAAFLPGTVSIIDESPFVPLEGWLCHLHDNQHTGVADCVLDPATLEFKWAFPTGAGIESSPVISGGTVYFGSDDTNVYAVNLLSGAEVWHHTLDSEVRGNGAIGHDAIYIGSEGGFFYALSRTDGSEIWNYQFTFTGMSGSDGLNVKGAILHEDRVYFCANNGSVYCLNATDGSEIFVAPTPIPGNGNSLRTTPAYYEAEDLLIITSDSYDVIGFDALSVDPEGTEIWRYYTGGFIGCTPTLDGTKVYFASEDDTYRFDYTTAPPLILDWSVPYNPTCFVGAYASGALDDEHYYALTFMPGKLFAHNRDTGVVDWMFPPVSAPNIQGYLASPAQSVATQFTASRPRTGSFTVLIQQQALNYSIIPLAITLVYHPLRFTMTAWWWAVTTAICIASDHRNINSYNKIDNKLIESARNIDTSFIFDLWRLL